MSEESCFIDPNDLELFAEQHLDGDFADVAADLQSTSIILSSEDTICLTLQTQPSVQPTKIINFSSNYPNKLCSIEAGQQNIVILSEPLPKKQEFEEDIDSLKQAFVASQQMLLSRLQDIEGKVENITSRCKSLEEKVETAINKTYEASCKIDSEMLDRLEGAEGRIPAQQDIPARAKSQLLSLNSEDYPDGSWLGNPENLDGRVRCCISPNDLSFLNINCTTPEKMALTLLDHLFDRETQARSNISGTGKYGKSKLNPLKIFGIRCHLAYRFGITEEHWQRIKRNLDSKCRTAFRRKQQGMSLAVKSFNKRPPSEGRKLTVPDVYPESSSISLTSELSSDTTLLSEQLSTKYVLEKLLCAEQEVGDISDIIHASCGVADMAT